MKVHPQLTRRQALAAGAGGAILGSLPASPLLAGPADAVEAASVVGDRPRRVLRVAHLTDTHLPEGEVGRRGFEACLAAVQGMDDPPGLIVFGGDNLMNVDGAEGAARADAQLAGWSAALQQSCSLPYLTAIGNHDVLRLDPTDGKKWATDSFGLAQRYFHLDRAGWRFIVLDSTEPQPGGGYKGRLDDEQFDWLGRTLADTPGTTQVCIVSHIPVLAVCAYFDGDNEESGDWRVPGAWMHIDARRIKDLFKQHPNVRLCLSGHMHLVDQVDYLGVRYACNGAVCGGWWRGDYHEFGPGFAVVDLYDDGSSTVDFQTYAWQAGG